MNTKKLKIPKGGLWFNDDEAAVSFSEKDDDGKAHFSMKAYSGNIIKGHWLFGDIAIDISGIKFGSKKRFPILEQHDLTRKVGVANSKPRTDDGVVFDKIKALNNDVAQEVMSNIEDDFPYQASISVKPSKIEELSDDGEAEVNGRKMKGPGIILRESRFREASVCVFGADPDTNVDSFSDEQEEILVECVNSKSVDFSEGADVQEGNNDTNNNGGSPDMKFTEELKKVENECPLVFSAYKDFEQKNTDLTQSVADKDKEIEQLKADKTNLSEQNTQYETRVASLEKNEALRTEKELKAQADNIVTEKLQASNIPVRLHDKVRKQLDYSAHVSDSNEFDAQKFTEAVDAEIKDWSAAFTESNKGTVLGFGANNDGSEHTNQEEQAADLADEMLGYLGVTSEK